MLAGAPLLTFPGEPVSLRLKIAVIKLFLPPATPACDASQFAGLSLAAAFNAAGFR